MTRQLFKLIAVDMDGTLLNSSHEITPRTERVLKEAMARDVQIIVATGRPRTPVTIGLLDQLALATPGIFLQGLAIHNPDGSLHTQEIFDPAVAEPFVRLAGHEGITLVGYTVTRTVVEARNRYSDRILDFGEPMPDEVGSFLDILHAVPINKWIVIADESDLPTIRSKLSATINGSAQIVQTLPYSLEILPKGVSKGTALAQLIKEMGISREQVIAFGDGENDIEMLELAGIGVAMGNAFPRCKEAADYITGTNNEDGLAEAVERFVLGR